jgi:hypothetical protein
MVTVIVAVCLVAQLLLGSIIVEAKSEVSFTSEDIFETPSKNSSIRFAANGTYESANLEDGVWTFRNLYMGDFRATEKLNLTVSATDCDLTFFPYLSAPYQYGVALLRWVILRYSILGQGTQVINLGFDPDNGQLDVLLDGNFAARNQGWTKDDEGTITVTGSYSNVTLWYIRHPEHSEDDSFLSDHYVVIGSTGFLAVIVVLAVIIRQRNREVSSPLNNTKVTPAHEEVAGGK